MMSRLGEGAKGTVGGLYGAKNADFACLGSGKIGENFDVSSLFFFYRHRRQTLFTLSDSAAEFYVNSAVAERFFAPLWEQFAQARGRRECRELSDREWFVLGGAPGVDPAGERAGVSPTVVS
jgi:hypothetical protein